MVFDYFFLSFLFVLFYFIFYFFVSDLDSFFFTLYYFIVSRMFYLVEWILISL